MTSEAETRKQRSLHLIRARGLPVSDRLPEIEEAEDVTIRSGEAIIRRILCLVTVARAALIGDTGAVMPFIARWTLDPALSPIEREFLQSDAISPDDAVRFSWRIEAVVPLMWAIGLYGELFLPSEGVQADEIIDYWLDFSHPDISRIGHRDAGDILDEADLVYRLHWAVKNGAETLDPDVVRERHHALNWLIGYEGDDWDDVQTDT